MKVAIIGSRDIKNITIEDYIPKEITMLVSGGARGSDALAEKWANKNNIPKLIIKPSYKRYGSKFAPIMRNKTIVENSDMVVAIWDGKSKGTNFTIEYAKIMNKPVKVYTIAV